MKTKALSVFVLALMVQASIYAQRSSDYCATVSQAPHIQAPLTHIGGRYVTSSGILRAFVLFARYFDDNETTSLWPNASALPTWAQNLLNSTYSPSGNYTNNSFTQYMYENSYGKLHLVGDVYYVTLPYPESHYDAIGDPPSAWTAIESDAFDQLAAIPGIDLGQYDNWQMNGDFQIPAGKDNKVDMCWFVMRNFHNQAYYIGIAQIYSSKTIGGVTIQSGFPGSGISVFNRIPDCIDFSTGITERISEYDNDGNRYTLFGTMAHEVSHYFFGYNHFGQPGNSQPLSSTRSSSHLVPYNVNYSAPVGVFMGYEKIRLGWITPHQIKTVTSDTVLSLPDMETTTDPNATLMVEIPISGTDQNIYIENRSWKSIYETRYSPINYGKSLTPGLLVYLIPYEDDYLSDTEVQEICEDGKWTWNLQTDGGIGPPGSYFGTASYGDVIVKNWPDPILGYDEREDIKVASKSGATYWSLFLPGAPTNGNKGIWYRGYNYIDEAHNVTDYVGHPHTLFTQGEVISPWSNGATHYWDATNVRFVPSTIGIEATGYDQQSSSYTLDIRTSNPQQLSPSKPQALIGSRNSVLAASLSWYPNQEPDVLNGLGTYKIYRAVYYSGANPLYSLIGTISSLQTSYTDNNWGGVSIPSGSTAYFRYRITAVDNTSKESIKSDSVQLSYTYQEFLQGLAYQGKSVSSAGTAYNGQRKLYRESSGKLHEVFASGSINGGEIFYRNSTDNGVSWNNTTRLSDGTVTSLAPCITAGPGPTVIVVWQQANGSNYNVVFSRSVNGGSSWSGISTIQSNFSCASPGPLPSVSDNMNTGSVVVVYRTSSGLRYVYSYSNMASWIGPSAVPNPNGNYNSPTTALYPVASQMVDKCNLAFSTDVGYSSQLYYSYYTFSSSTWSAFSSLSSALPGSYQQHKNPSLAVSSTSTSIAHVAWEATLMAPPTPVLVHRKGSSGNFGSQYTVIQYQSAYNPSITGLTSDNAWMVFQNSSSGGFSKVQYSNSGGSWVWGPVTNLWSGNYAQLSVGASNAKYLWTAGTSSPYTIAIGTETLSKSVPLAVSYSRELNFIDTKTGSSITLEIKQPQMVKKDGTISLIPFVDAPPDSVVIAAKEILTYGNTQSFTASKDIDSLELQYSVRTIKSGDMLHEANAAFSFDLCDINTGNILKTIDSRMIAKSSDTTSVLRQVNIPAKSIQDLAQGRGMSIRPSVVGVAGDSPDVNASLGHVYRYGSEGGSELPKPMLAENITPKENLLEQNYPNPFNPVTQIEYSILGDAYVTLKVFDLLGREVATLAEGAKAGGYYTAVFDGSKLSSGVYFTRLIVQPQDGSKTVLQTRKIVLAK